MELDELKTYIDGKMKRYNLLFAVNGGAFAIAKLIGEGKNVGEVTLLYLAMGAILFTILMWWDIWCWGWLMKKEYDNRGKGERMFGWVGKLILSSLTLLLTGVWILAAWKELIVVLKITGGSPLWFIIGSFIILILAATAVANVIYKESGKTQSHDDNKT